MKVTLLVRILLLVAITGSEATAFAQNLASDPISSPSAWGPPIGLPLGKSISRQARRSLRIVHNAARFRMDTGMDFEVKLFGEVPFPISIEGSTLTFGAGFAERGGTFGQTVTDAEMVLNNSNIDVPYSRLNSFSATLAYIDLFRGFRITPLKKIPVRCFCGPRCRYPARGIRSLIRRQNRSNRLKAYFIHKIIPRRSPMARKARSQVRNTLFGIRGILGYELSFGSILMASPELSYYIPLNEVTTSRPWQVSSVSVGGSDPME